MIAYLIKTALCLAFLLVVYLLFLEKEKMHGFKRFYLLGSLVFSLTIPLITTVAVAPAIQIAPYKKATAIVGNYISGNNRAIITRGAATGQGIPARTVIVTIYGLVTLGFLIRFGRNILLIRSKANKNQVVHFRGARLVLLQENIVSHTFGNTIFINAREYAETTIEKEVLSHELAHVQQQHSLDILFVELLQAIFWFNPLFILYKRAIQLNHEFLADQVVVHTYADTDSYLRILVNRIAPLSIPPLSSSFNFMTTKKRLKMLTTKNVNRKIVLVKKLALLPVAICAAVFFSSSSTAGEKVFNRVKNTPAIKSLAKLLPVVVKTEPLTTKATTTTGKKAQLLPDTPRNSYKRVTLKDEYGKEYDMIYVQLAGGGQLSTSAHYKGKAGFLIGDKLYTEDQLTEFKNALDTTPLSGDMGVGGNDVKLIAGLDLSAYDVIFYFVPKRKEKATQNAVQTAINREISKIKAVQDWEIKETIMKSLSTKEPYEAIVKDYFKTRPQFPLSYVIEIDHNLYILSTMGKEATYNLSKSIKPGDKITVKLQSKAMDDITPYVLFFPEFVKKGGQTIYQFSEEMLKEFNSK